LKATKEYFDKTIEIMRQIESEEMDKIEKAAAIMAQSIINGRFINVFGSGYHSFLPAVEMFRRAGGLVHIRPIIPKGICESLDECHVTDFCQSVPGYASAVLDEYRFKIQKGDVMIIPNTNGINCCCVEAALESKKRRLKVIAITSPAVSKGAPPDYKLHPTKKSLFEVADLVIDIHVPYPDAIIKVKGCNELVGAVSTIPITLVINLLTLGVVEKTIEKGHRPMVLRGGSLPGSKEVNQQYRKMIYTQIK